jgi:hypothetical protein
VQSSEFNPINHLFKSSVLQVVVDEAIDFFLSTPVYNLPPGFSFQGEGVYAIYFVGQDGIYQRLGTLNRPSVQIPIYVGQASSKGVRQGRVEETTSTRVHGRLREHSRSIGSANNLSLDDFRCRFVLMLGKETGLIRTVESALIAKFRPLWNTYVDGFGIHDPGKGRARQLQSEWDSIHPGRSFVSKMESSPRTVEPILDKIDSYFTLLDSKTS